VASDTVCRGAGVNARPFPYEGWMMQQEYWYAWRWFQGHPIVRGHWSSEQEAYREGLKDEALGADFEVVKLPTRDLERAKKFVRDLVYKRTGSLDAAFARFRDKPLKTAR